MEKRAGGSSSTTSRHQAVIIGAGPSGIGAARTLFQAGIDAVILEARDRIGGRMWETSLTANLDTRKGECDSSVTIQLGANWIHGLCSDFNPMFERAQQLQLSLHQTSSDDEPGHDVMLFDSGSYCIPPNPIEAFDCTSDNPVVVNLPQSFAPVAGTEYQLVLQRYYWIRERFDQFCSSNAGILSLSQSFEQAISCSENELGICSPLHRRCLNWIFDRILIDWAEDSLENLEAMVYASTGSDGAFGEALVAGGYFKVLEDLALEFPLTVLLNHVVESVIVMDSSECVEIHCSNGSIFVADHCIVTLPVGVLKSMDVTFVPKIPPAIESVLSQVSVGLMNLVWILFPAFFWPDNVNFFGVARDSASTSNFTTFLAPPMSDSKGCRQPVLMCQVTGQLAKEIEILSDESIAVKVMKVLRNMFGEVPYFPFHCGIDVIMICRVYQIRLVFDIQIGVLIDFLAAHGVI